MKIRIIDISVIEGFIVGNAENIDKGTGCTVIVCEDGAVGGVDVRGGAPATRETDLLRSENTVDAVNAVVLSGGSAFGLEAASGVMRELSDRGIGFDTGFVKVPIVCGASLFDLSVGDSSVFPDVEMGREAVRNAYEGVFEHGNRGAGTGASVGKFLGMNRAMKSGLGTFACGDDFVQVGAVVAVNSVGDIYNGAGNIVAGLRTEDGASIYGSIKSLKNMVHSIADSSSDNNNNDNEFIEDAQPNADKSDIADAIKNAFSNKIKDAAKTYGYGDALSLTESEKSEAADSDEESIETIADFYTSDAADTEAPAVNPADEEFKDNIDINDDGEPEAASEIAEYAENPEPEYEAEPQDEDMGYDIPFNTTIACLITNAKMTKSQANKLASVLHDAYARAIKPVHSSMDGDTIFVLSTGKAEVDFDAFAALSTDVMQYAIIDAATSAKSAYGLPAACDINKK